MQISIRQRLLSISDRFDIFVDDQQMYTAKRRFFSSTIYLKNQLGSTIISIRKRPFGINGFGYKIKVIDGLSYNLKTQSLRKGVWTLDTEEYHYHLYEHEGYAYSLYKEETQIAFCKKNEVVFWGKDQFEITADYDVDQAIVIAMFLIIDHAYFLDRLVRIPFQTKFFSDGKSRNWHWRPKLRD